MSLFIGHRSAYDFWLTNDAPSVSKPMRVRIPSGARIKGSDLASLDLSRFRIANRPVHLIVRDAEDRCRTRDSVCHVWNGPTPTGSFVRLDSGLYISSPVRTFTEMSRELSLVELIRFGYQLCSTYVYDKDSTDGFRKREAPLTTIRALQSYAEKMRHQYGSKKTMRALRFLAESSASPMETILSMSLSVPRMIGGYGIEIPGLNVCINAHAQSLVDRDHFDCDPYWKKHRVCVEYDSQAFHSGDEAETHDSARRSALLAEGITVVSVTRDQFFDARTFDETARTIAKLVGNRLPNNDASWMMRRYKLRTELLRDPNPWRN